MTTHPVPVPSPSRGDPQRMLVDALESATARINRSKLDKHHLGVFVKQAASDPFGQFRKDTIPMWEVYYTVLAVTKTQQLIVCSKAKSNEYRFAMLHHAPGFTLCVYGISPADIVGWLRAEFTQRTFEDVARQVRDRLQKIIR